MTKKIIVRVYNFAPELHLELKENETPFTVKWLDRTGWNLITIEEIGVCDKQ
jgi:hypothetical protein